MLIKLIATSTRNIAPLPRFTTRKQPPPQQPETQNTEKSELVESKESFQLMDDNFEKIKMKGLQERDITGVDAFQKDILTTNSFNIMHPRIEPKIASLSTTMGLDLGNNSYLAEINLGKIKVKKQNEVFLSQVDPHNIPDYYDIVFDYSKQMSLVGKKVEDEPTASKDGKTKGDMSISTRRAFEERTQSELSRDILGVSINPIYNSRIIWKKLLVSVTLIAFLIDPIIETWFQMQTCRKSILEIEQQRLKQLRKLKRQAMINAMLANPDMKII